MDISSTTQTGTVWRVKGGPLNTYFSKIDPKFKRLYLPYLVELSSVQSLSRVQHFATMWTAARQDSLSITKFGSLLRLISIESVMPSSHLILFRNLLLLPSIPPSIRDFSNKSTFRMRWPNYWSFTFRISPSKEHPGLISFRKDWLILIIFWWSP